VLGSGDRGEAEDRSRWRREGAQLSSVGLLRFFDARDEDDVLGEQIVRGGGDGGHSVGSRRVCRARRSRTGSAMAKKGTKATRKFAASGQLKKKIEARRKHQQIQKKAHKNKNARNKGKERAQDGEEHAEEVKSLKKRHVVLNSLSVDGALHVSCSLKGIMSVDDLLGASFMAEDEDVSLKWIPS
jgi:hypothetical protein